MRLELIGLHSTDVQNLETWGPITRSQVYFPLTIEIGEVGKSGGNFFEVVIATPEGVRAFLEEYKMTVNRNILIFLDYDWKDIRDRILSIVNSCNRSNWEESIQCLQRFFRWEYEE